MKQKDVAVIIPVYNEATVIRDVVEAVLKDFKYVICVDDGSRDNSSEEIQKTNVYLVEHSINMGQGAALQTGIEFSRQFSDIKYFATYDADGQHSLNDLHNMIRTIKNSDIDIVLGSRFLGTTTGMRSSKRIVLKLAIWFSNITSGLNLTDTHNGLRVFNRRVAEEIQITLPDMAHASEILEIIAEKKYNYVEVPVKIQYSEYSLSKGQSIINAVNIGFDMLLRKISK